MISFYSIKQKIKPELFFSFTALFFGLILLLLTPPFQSPDEINHFYRAYQIADGKMIAIKKDNRIGGYVPTSLVEITKPFLELPGNMHAKIKAKSILQEFETPLNIDNKTFVDFPNTGMYAPISYLPQSIGIFILKQFYLPPLYLFYGTRLFTLLFWVFCIFWAIKIIPFYKWLFTLIVLLPMSVFINMSLSADVVSNVLSFILITTILNFAYKADAISTKKFLLIAFLLVLLASAKLVYTPIILLFLLIPKKKFKTNHLYYINLFILAFLSLSTLLFWSSIMNHLYLPYSMYNEAFRNKASIIDCANMHKQAEYIATHGFYLVDVFFHSLIRSFDMYFQGFIGTFGWLDTKLPLWLIYAGYIAIFIIALTENDKKYTIKLKHKLIAFVGFISIVFLVLLSQHLTWDCVGSDIIVTIQGRYFIPAFPLILILFYNSTFRYPKIVIPIVILFTILSLCFSIKTIYNRYYIDSVFETIIIKSDSEKIKNENLFTTNKYDVFLENAQTQSSEKVRSGKFSILLNPSNPYGYTYRLYDCGIGDIINVDVWRLGKTGDIIISGNSGDFFCNTNYIIEKDSMNWEHLHLKFVVPKNMGNKEVGIYVFNNSEDNVYFDDITISYQKKL